MKENGLILIVYLQKGRVERFQANFETETTHSRRGGERGAHSTHGTFSRIPIEQLTRKA